MLMKMPPKMIVGVVHLSLLHTDGAEKYVINRILLSI